MPYEEPEELVLVVHFHGVRSSGGLCMAAIKKLVAIAREKGLDTIARALESAYVDECNCSLGSHKEVEEIKEHMLKFMKEHGFPIKELACSDEADPKEHTDSTMIDVGGYHWEPHTDQMKIMTPKIFIENKRKDRLTNDTRVFEDKVSIENL